MASPRDQNRVPSVLIEEEISRAATPVTGKDFTGVVAEHVAIVDGSGTQITGFGLITVPFTEIDVTYPTTSTEVYTYKNGATTVGTITLTYTDAVTKQILQSVVKT